MQARQLTRPTFSAFWWLLLLIEHRLGIVLAEKFHLCLICSNAGPLSHFFPLQLRTCAVNRIHQTLMSSPQAHVGDAESCWIHVGDGG